jgi:hypothetical protein
LLHSPHFVDDITLLDSLSYGQLAGTLTDLGQIRPREPGSPLSDQRQINRFSHLRATQAGAKNGQTSNLIG